MTLLVGSIFHMTRKIVSEMTYNVSMGTLNPTIPYHTTMATPTQSAWVTTTSTPTTTICTTTTTITVPISHPVSSVSSEEHSMSSKYTGYGTDKSNLFNKFNC